MTTTLTAPDGTKFRTASGRRYICGYFGRVDGRVIVDARSDSLATARKRAGRSGFVVDRVMDTVVYGADRRPMVG